MVHAEVNESLDAQDVQTTRSKKEQNDKRQRTASYYYLFFQENLKGQQGFPIPILLCF